MRRSVDGRTVSGKARTSESATFYSADPCMNPKADVRCAAPVSPVRQPPTRSRKRFRSLHALALPCAVLACTRPVEVSDSSTVTPSEFDSERAWRHLERIVALGDRPAGSAGIERLRVYIEDELRAIGLEPVRESFRESTPRGEIGFANVHVEIGASERAPIVILGTHIDTKSGLPFEFLGANDGGSGTAVLLELARCLHLRDPAPPVVYRLVFLDGEEAFRKRWSGTDNCYGSRHHVEQLQQEGSRTRVAAFVLLDMVGDRELRLTRELRSDPELVAIFFDAARRIGLEHHVGAREQEIDDDHVPFIEAGIPSVDLIDFEYGPDNDWWHSADDRLEKCAPGSLEAIGRIVLAGLPALERRAAGRSN